VKQMFKITWMNLQSIPHRLGLSLVICIGTASVVAVLVTVLSMATGLVDTVASGADPSRVLVMRKGALAESLSSLSREAMLVIETAPGILEVDGRRAVSPEIVVSVDLPLIGGNGNAAVILRGLTGSGWQVRPELEIVEGRVFDSGRFEVVVGRALQSQFADLAVGDTVSFYSNSWTVVGVFEQHGAVSESQLIADARTLMSAANRNVYNSATVVMEDMGEFDAFKMSLDENPQLTVEAFKETVYYERQAESAGQILKFVAYVISAIMALGALFGAVNTMYTAVATRTAEIATLRALGFGGAAVVISVLTEALALSLIGAGFGALVSWLLFNGTVFNAGGQLGAIGVRLEVGMPVIAIGVVWACTIGLLAGFLPALRAARLPVAIGLRIGA